MDPFEVRIEFLNLVRGLQPLQQSIGRACAYANKHVALADHLVDCIVELLGKQSLNSRANIVTLLDVLCTEASAYTPKVVARLAEVVLLAVPSHELVNLYATEAVVRRISDRTSADTSFWVEQYRGNLVTTRDREAIAEKKNYEAELPLLQGIDGAWQVLLDRQHEAQYQNEWLHAHGVLESELEMTREQVLQRMEADRERSKRGREGIWAVEKGMEWEKVYQGYGSDIGRVEEMDVARDSLGAW